MELKDLSWIAFVLLLTRATSGYFIQKPANIATKKGDSSEHMACQDSITTATTFWASQPSNSFVYITENGVVYPAYSNKYVLAGDFTRGEYKLSVNRTTSSDAGTYRCNVPQTNTEVYAQLIILDSDTVCDANATLNNLVEGQVVQSWCEMGFTGLWGPIMTWRDLNGNLVENVVKESTPNRMRYVHTFTAKPEDNNNKFSTVTYFTDLDEATVPDPDWDHSRVAPSYTFTHSTPAFVVKYKPKKHEVSPIKLEYIPGNTITCFAEGNPTPQFKWVDLRQNSTLATSRVLEITAAMKGVQEYQCQASNEIGISSVNLTAKVIIPTTTAPPTTPISTTINPGEVKPTTTDPTIGGIHSGGGLSSGAIAGIVIGVLLALIILFIILWCICCRRSPPPSKTEKKPRLDGVDAVRHPQPVGKPDINYISEKQGPPINPYYNHGMPGTPPREPFMYGADLALDDTPRSRKPIQVYEPGYQGDIRQV